MYVNWPDRRCHACVASIKSLDPFDLTLTDQNGSALWAKITKFSTTVSIDLTCREEIQLLINSHHQHNLFHQLQRSIFHCLPYPPNLNSYFRRCLSYSRVNHRSDIPSASTNSNHNIICHIRNCHSWVGFKNAGS